MERWHSRCHMTDESLRLAHRSRARYQKALQLHYALSAWARVTPRRGARESTQVMQQAIEDLGHQLAQRTIERDQLSRKLSAVKSQPPVTTVELLQHVDQAERKPSVPRLEPGPATLPPSRKHKLLAAKLVECIALNVRVLVLRWGDTCRAEKHAPHEDTNHQQISAQPKNEIEELRAAFSNKMLEYERRIADARAIRKQVEL